MSLHSLEMNVARLPKSRIKGGDELKPRPVREETHIREKRGCKY